MAKYMKTEEGYMNIPDFALAPFKPSGKSYLTFSSLNSFTLAVYDTTKHWDGTLEYFSSDKTWITWDGTSALSAVADDGEYVLYLRGIGNTNITRNNYNYHWVLTGSNIACIGNIENLLDYATVESGGHPMMVNYCYDYMFQDCTSLTQAPALPATTLTHGCYASMFKGCASLTQAPALPATTLAHSCYASMFQGCTSLTQAPALPATTLAPYCYTSMFEGCTSLTQAPVLPATTMANFCYEYMFEGCTSLTQAPALPATTMANRCYRFMFEGCTSLTQAPALPATTLADLCYASMFQGCTSLTQAPALPATTLTYGCYASMFQDCTSLKLSSIKTDEYTQEYRIPSSGDGVTATFSLDGMFTSTGGTFTGTPEINTTYYLSSDNMIVRDTEVATLNGYVGSMINNAIPIPDTTLSIAGKSADAKAVGDRLSALSEEIVTTSESKVSAHNTGADTHSDIRLLIQGLTNRLNALADSDDTTLDQLSEVVAYIKSNRELISAITTDKVSVADIVNNLTTNVANKPLSAAQGVALKALIDAITVPDKLPNPNALTFTGAVTGSYDGSAPLSVEIPQGGGGGYNDWVLLHSMVLEQDTQYIVKDLGANYNEVRICFENLWCVEGTSAGLAIAVNGGSTGLSAQSAFGGSFVNTKTYPCAAIIVVRKETDTFSSCTILGKNTGDNHQGSGVYPLIYNVANGISKVQFSLASYGTHTMNTGAIIEVWGR